MRDPVEEIVDAFVADGDFDSAWAVARGRARTRAGWVRPLHGALVAAAALVVGIFALGGRPAPSGAGVIPAEGQHDDVTVIGVGRAERSSVEVPIADVQIDDDAIVEVRRAEGRRLFALVGRSVGHAEVTLVLDDGSTVVRRVEVVGDRAPREGEVWVDLDLASLVRVEGVEGHSIADPRFVQPVPHDGDLYLAGRQAGTTDVLIRRDGEWQQITIAVGSGGSARIPAGVAVVPTDPVALSVGDRTTLPSTSDPSCTTDCEVQVYLQQRAIHLEGREVVGVQPGVEVLSFFSGGWEQHYGITVVP